MADELQLTLIENAEDFLFEAVKYAKASSPRDWKYATLHLWSALRTNAGMAHCLSERTPKRLP